MNDSSQLLSRKPPETDMRTEFASGELEPSNGTRSRTLRVVVAAGKILGFVLVLLVCCGLAYEQIDAWRDAHVLKQVGRSVDIGGRTLNMSCTGEGSPTVIFESARTAPGYVWTPTQRRVSTFTRACWYDRATVGWSDPGPDPSWGDSAARDLHQLLRNADVTPPFVLVGHPFGGYIIRLYNHLYPDEVSGMVFVDTALENAGTIQGMPHRDPPRLPRAAIRGLSIALGRLGFMPLTARDPGPLPKGWAAEEWDTLARLRRQRHLLLADAQVGPESATADLMRAIGRLGDMPMIVLTEGRPIRSQASVEARVRNGWVDLQRRFATRRRNAGAVSFSHDEAVGRVPRTCTMSRSLKIFNK